MYKVYNQQPFLPLHRGCYHYLHLLHYNRQSSWQASSQTDFTYTQHFNNIDISPELFLAHKPSYLWPSQLLSAVEQTGQQRFVVNEQYLSSSLHPQNHIPQCPCSPCHNTPTSTAHHQLLPDITPPTEPAVPSAARLILMRTGPRFQTLLNAEGYKTVSLSETTVSDFTVWTAWWLSFTLLT